MHIWWGKVETNSEARKGDIVKGTYKHYKGGIYTVIGIAKHSETQEEMVIYQGQDEQIWARPRAMFNEILVSSEWSEIERFKRID